MLYAWIQLLVVVLDQSSPYDLNLGHFPLIVVCHSPMRRCRWEEPLISHASLVRGPDPARRASGCQSSQGSDEVRNYVFVIHLHPLKFWWFWFDFVIQELLIIWDHGSEILVSLHQEILMISAHANLRGYSSLTFAHVFVGQIGELRVLLREIETWSFLILLRSLDWTRITSMAVTVSDVCN